MEKNPKEKVRQQMDTEGTLAERIKRNTEILVELRMDMDEAYEEMRDLETGQKLDSEERKTEYIGAKNSEIRSLLLAEWLSEDEEYQQVRASYRDLRSAFKQALLAREGLRLLVDASASAGASA